jgi:hypothetical protein
MIQKYVPEDRYGGGNLDRGYQTQPYRGGGTVSCPPPAENYADPPAMDPYTTQIINRLNDAEKMVAVLEQQIGTVVDKLLGGSPLPAEKMLTEKTLEPNGAIEHIVRQTNFLNRRLESLSDLAARLQIL